MNIKIKIIAIAILLNANTTQTAIVGYNTKEAGRTGDKLIQFTKALWVAYEHNLPFISSPFKYSDKLLIHLVDDAQAKKTAHTLPVINARKNTDLNQDKDALFQISYYFQHSSWGKPLEVTTWSGLFNNKDFLALLKKCIAPSFHIPPIAIPKDRIAIAVHVRKGGGIDLPLYSDRINNLKRNTFADKIWPIKFPPESFYIRQIEKLAQILSNQKLYIHIFTDDLHPDRVAARFEQKINNPDIMYGYRKSGNFHDNNVLEDLFNITTFDYLIRGGSNYGQIAHLLGDYKMVLYPKEAHWQGSQMYLDEGIIS
jgi:hypothetical protein